MPDAVLAEREGPIATVTLNRPQALNALNLEAWARLWDVVRVYDGDDSVRCIVLRGAGDRAFSAGADISEFENERRNMEQARRYGHTVASAMDALAGCRHPTVALISGACVGGGLEIAATCDIRICGESSRFGIPVSRLGLTMAYGELRHLVSLVGRAAALEILLEGSVFRSERAQALGLVTRVVPDDRVETEAYDTARRIARGAPLVHRWHKQFIRRLADPAPLTPEEIDEGYACFDTQDFRIGYRAFLDKQEPEFKGR